MKPEDLCKYIIDGEIFNDIPSGDASYEEMGRYVWPDRYTKLDKLAKAALAGNRTKWIYRYLRADREEIDMGPYETRENAVKAMNEHRSCGAFVVGPISIDKDYELFKG